MVRLLVEEARHALPPPNDAQCGRDDRSLISTSTAGALPRSGFVLRPEAESHTRRRHGCFAPQARTRFAGGAPDSEMARYS
ncbi:MAG: hypothetical protein E5Y60_18880, partial [Mesorhizobium sp.]